MREDGIRVALPRRVFTAAFVRRVAFPVAFACLTAGPAAAQLRGHGGPVRALAVAPDGRVALSGSFDQTAILWAIDEGRALAVLRFHDGAVNAALALPDGRFATGGEDGKVALWRAGAPDPEVVFAEHAGPVAGLALSPDGRTLASASWDGTAVLRPLDGGSDSKFPARVLSGHAGNVNAVAFLPDGRPVTAGYDDTIRIWPAGASAEAPAILTLPTPLNTLAVAPDGEIAAGGADGALRLLAADGIVRATIEVGPTPVVALAVSGDGSRLAAAGIGGAVAVIDRAAARTLRILVGPGLPVWSLAFRPDGEIVTGGGDRLVRRWDAATGEPVGALAMARPQDPLHAFAGERGAEVFRACVACHTLKPDEGVRAGPTLSGLFGRRIATAPGYRYSEALRHLDIVWNAETVSRLFEVGPARYTPGTKMPEQVVTSPEDRAALVQFLEKATKLP